MGLRVDHLFIVLKSSWTIPKIIPRTRSKYPACAYRPGRLRSSTHCRRIPRTRGKPARSRCTSCSHRTAHTRACRAQRPGPGTPSTPVQKHECTAVERQAWQRAWSCRPSVVLCFSIVFYKASIYFGQILLGFNVYQKKLNPQHSPWPVWPRLYLLRALNPRVLPAPRRS